MRTIAKIINHLGGLAALRDNPQRIESPGFMRLCVEHIGTGPRGLPMVSVAHYFEQNGDLIADPDVTFEVMPDDAGLVPEDIKEWGPVAIIHGATGHHAEACWVADDGKVMVRPAQIADIRSFARMWSRNLASQGFLEAFLASRK